MFFPRRTSDFFEVKLKRGRRNIDYLLPPEICVAINVVVSCLRQVSQVYNGIIMLFTKMLYVVYDN